MASTGRAESLQAPSPSVDQGQTTARRAMAVASDPFALLELRIEAVEILANHRTQASTELLLDLTDPGQPAGLQNAAFDSLAKLSGVEGFGRDPIRWRQWYEQHRGLTSPQWYESLLRNFYQQQTDLTAREAWAAARLVDVQRQLYQLLPPEDRSKALVSMLGDPLESVRLLGLELMVQRLVEEKLPSDALTEQLRKQLDDDSAEVRRRSALLLRDINDPSAAQIAARRLVESTEHDPQVLAAYLKLTARQPNLDAVAAALGFLDHKQLGRDSAAVLAEGVDAGLLTAAQVDRAKRICRMKVEDGRLPDPQTVALLGRIGDQTDWRSIEQWLNVADIAVKGAAALAWARSDHPLLPLAQRADDLVIRPIVLLEAAKKGDRIDTLRTLLDYPPAEAEAPKAWADALIAMSARVSVKDVIGVEVKLAEMQQPVTLRVRILSAAIDASAGAENVPDALLLLRRAELHWRSGDAPAAVADYKKITEIGAALSQINQQRRDRGELRAQLGVGYLPGAVEVAQRLLASSRAGDVVDPVTLGFITESFLDAAERDADANQIDRAKLILSALRGLFEKGVPPAHQLRVEALDQRLQTPGAVKS